MTLKRPSWMPAACRLLPLLVALALPAPVTARDDSEPFILNLENADLRLLIQTVSERTGQNFVVDPRVRAEVTVVSSRPVDDRELLNIFETVLQIHGFVTVPSGDVTRIVPAPVGRQGPIPVEDEASREQHMVTRVLTVEHVSASELVPVLRPLLPQEAHLAAYEPTNRILVSDSAANIERIARILRRVDQPLDSEVDVIPLENASANEVVEILSTLGGAGADGTQASRFAVDSRTNSVLIRGDGRARLETRMLIANLDTPLDRPEGNTRVRYLRYADAEDLVDLLVAITDVRAGDIGETPLNDDTVVIQADPSTNALVIKAPPDRLPEIDAVIRQLDIRRAQVVVEAIIVEITMDRAREFGVQFAVDGSESGSTTPAALTSFGGPGTNIVQLATEPESIGPGLSLGAVDTRGSTNFGALLRMIATDVDSNILSTPSLVTMDNQEAEIVVGQNVPFITGQFTGIDAGTDARSPFQTIERRDVGLTLRIKPQINEGNTIKMDIAQEVSSIAEVTQTAADLVTNTRTLTTTVLVEDGQTLVLGGLIDDTVRTRTEKVPFLGDIPVIGRLFRFDSSSTVKQNLMVFIHPRILHDQRLADSYTGEKYNYMRSAQLRHQQDDSRVMQPETPVLPEFEALPDIELHYREADPPPPTRR